MSVAQTTRQHELHVLTIISGGLIGIILAIVLGLFLDNNGLPNWAENVLVSVATACALKLGDCISALIALSTGGTLTAFGNQLANTAPVEQKPPPPKDAAEGAEQAADAATERAGEIAAAADAAANEGVKA